jgi:hypothetical protein
MTDPYTEAERLASAAHYGPTDERAIVLQRAQALATLALAQAVKDLASGYFTVSVDSEVETPA